jgi:hypothetical protein
MAIRAQRQAELDASIFETQQLELELAGAQDAELAQQAVMLLARIERMAEAALASDG